MEIFHSITSRLVLASKTPDEEEGESGAIQNQCKPYRDSSERSLEKLLSFSSIYKAIKGLVQKLCAVFNYLKPRKEADPLLPIQNQASTSTALCEPLLPRICSRRATEDSSSSHSLLTITFGTLTDSSGDVDCENERDSAPEIRCWNGEIVEEIAQQSSPCVGLINSREEVKEQVKRSSSIVVNEEKRIKHYSSRHKILLVGEGDFSFSACLAVAFGCATNIIATSLNSQEYLKSNAMSNIAELKSRGCKVMHGIDATEMANHELLRQLKFDRIIFNFPFAGFFRREPTECQLRRHRKLVSKFVMNAKQMVSENGEIHISHKTNGIHAEFKLESIASSHGLRLIEAVKFKCGHYPGYNTKYGFGGDKNFNPYPSKTFKFGLKTLPAS